MSTEKNYNGWTNYETWVVKLWMDNDQGSYIYWKETAEQIAQDAEPTDYLTKREQATDTLAERLREEFEESNPVGDKASVWADLMSAALSEVRWMEIARSMIDDMDWSAVEESEEEEDDESEEE